MRMIPALVLAAFLGGCGSDQSTAPDPVPPPPTVRATPQITFEPGDVEVVASSEVTWVFESVPHNVFFSDAADGPADITGFNVDTSVVRKFDRAGTFAYECRIHPGMRGQVTVRPIRGS